MAIMDVREARRVVHVMLAAGIPANEVGMWVSQQVRGRRLTEEEAAEVWGPIRDGSQASDARKT